MNLYIPLALSRNTETCFKSM